MDGVKIRTAVAWGTSFWVRCKDLSGTKHGVCGIVADFSHLAAAARKSFVNVVIARVISALPPPHGGQRLVIVVAARTN